MLHGGPRTPSTRATVFRTDSSVCSRGTGGVDDESLIEFRLYVRECLLPLAPAPSPPPTVRTIACSFKSHLSKSHSLGGVGMQYYRTQHREKHASLINPDAHQPSANRETLNIAEPSREFSTCLTWAVPHKNILLQQYNGLTCPYRRNSHIDYIDNSTSLLPCGSARPLPTESSPRERRSRSPTSYTSSFSCCVLTSGSGALGWLPAFGPRSKGSITTLFKLGGPNTRVAQTGST